MTTAALVRRSLSYHARTHAAVVAAVAIAASVLIGALVVGDSLRATLRDLALARLGRTDSALLAQRYVPEELAQEVASRTGRATAPLVVLDGAVAHEESGRRATRVKVYGVDERFWTFHGVPAPAMDARQAALSQALADELSAGEGSTLLVRVEQPSDIPAASLFGRKEDRGRTLRVTRGAVLARGALGEFSLESGQQAVRAVFVPLRLLQRTLAQPSRANAILLGAGGSDPWPPTRGALTLAHLGLRFRPLAPQGVLSLESATGFVPDDVARAAGTAASAAGLAQQPVLTYLATDMRVGDRSVPYSLVSALAPEPLDDVAGAHVSANGVVLNEWAALELGARPGDRVTLTYLIWEEGGRLATREASLPLEVVVPLRGAAADRDLAPEYPGITDSAHLSDWDPPFPIDLSRVRPQDEKYWDEHRATPKAFLALTAGQALWRHRLGALTSIRLEPRLEADLEAARAAFEAALLPRLDPARAGIVLLPVRAQALEAAQGAGDFGQYFLAFSFFLIVAALLLAGLVFRLNVEQRSREIGLLRAVGWRDARVRAALLAEGLVLAAVGAVLGLLGAVVYAWLVLLGLRTIWIDAVGLGELRLALTPVSLTVGAAAAIVAGVVSVRLALRALRHTSPRQLLAGGTPPAATRTTGRRALWVAAFGIALAAGLSYASVRGTVAPAGGFFGAGFGLLAASLAVAWSRLTHPRASSSPLGSERALGLRNATWRPGRSLLVMALIAFGTFVVVAVGAFRKDAQTATSDRKTGHGGYALVGESTQPLLHDPATLEGREALGLAVEPGALADVSFTRFRLLPGDEASCLNLYRPQRPRVLGAPESFLREGRFVFADSLARSDAERANPWLLLLRAPEDGALPAITDANSLQYVLHHRLGDVMEVERGGSPLKLRFVAALKDSLFQGELVVAEDAFLDAFPDDPGYRFFLLDAPPATAAEVSGALESRLAPFGLDLSSAPGRLDRYHRVENAYLSTFQTLGALGLLLGTVGLGAVLLRNALERRRELALLRAVGYRRRNLTRLVLAENGALLAAGLAAGTLSALLAIAPTALARGASLPVTSLAILVAAVAAAGLVASLAASALVHRMPLLGSLRSE